MKIVGIDYGHGETSAGYVNSENVQGNEIPMQDLQIKDEKTVIPSIICKAKSGEYIINPSTKDIAKAEDVGISFKAPLVGNERYKQIDSKNKVFFKEFLSHVYNSIVENENNPLHVDDGNMDFKVYIACPSGWDKNQIKEYKRFVCEDCKIPLVDIVEESRAAYIASRRKVGEGIRTQGGNVLVIDFGSSTVDFTYFNNDSKFDPVHEGYPYGASQIEKDILSYIIKSNPEAKNNVNFVCSKCGERMGMNSLLFGIRKQKEEYFSTDNSVNFNPSIHLRELFSDKSLTGMYIEAKEEEGYTKEFLIKYILKDYIGNLSKMLDDFLTKDGVTSIDKVILTGGASRMFFFKDMVATKYGVSKENHTLIVDLEPNVTISEGIAAFGYMSEMSNLVEFPLNDAVDEWIADQLPKLLKSTIEKCIGDMYYSEFSHITYRYGKGEIIKDGKYNLDGLEDEIISLLNRWTASGESMSKKINMAVQESMISSIKEKLSNFAKTWGLTVDDADFSVNIKLGIQASLTPESCQGLIHYIWQKLKEFIDQRDFWGWDNSTSPFKDRDKDDRESIERNMDMNLRTYFNDLEYISPLDDSVSSIASMIKAKVKVFVDNAKLQQYR